MKNIIKHMVIILFMFSTANAMDNRIDGIRPDAPELAKIGNLSVGVRTLSLIHKNQIDAVNIEEGQPIPRYDRPLTVEVWYPAQTTEQGTQYHDVLLRDAKTLVSLYGSAVRDAAPLKAENGHPLIVISHGYPGNRFLMSHFGENLASKGYVVVSIDHTDSMYQDAGAFASTLLNRPLDQRFILNQMTKFNNTEDHFLFSMVDTDNAGLMGYSMGGYGSLITAGAGITKTTAETPATSPQNILRLVEANSDAHKKLMAGNNYKAIISFAPWGMERGFWDDEGLKNIHIPMFFISGSEDETSGYETGTRAIYEKTTGIDRYLLTFDNAGHNAIAPIPAPKEAWSATYNDGKSVAFSHYNDPVWDSLRANNIAQHFVTAYFGTMLKNDQNMDEYLDLIKRGNDSKDDTQWKGFKAETAKGLYLEHLSSDN